MNARFAHSDIDDRTGKGADAVKLNVFCRERKFCAEQIVHIVTHFFGLKIQNDLENVRTRLVFFFE